MPYPCEPCVDPVLLLLGMAAPVSAQQKLDRSVLPNTRSRTTPVDRLAAEGLR